MHTGNSSADCPCRKALLRKSIFTAAQDGDLDHVKSFFECTKSHLHADFADDFGYTSLHYACQWNRQDVVKYLLEHGANPNSAICGATPLHRAAFRGSIEAVSLLLEYNADLNVIDTSFGDKRTPLHKAASQGHLKIQDLLLRAGADPTIRDAGGLTYLDVVREHEELCQSPVPHIERSVDDCVSPFKGIDANIGSQCYTCQARVYAVVRRQCCGTLECDDCYNQGISCPNCHHVLRALPPQQETKSLPLVIPKATSTRAVRGLFDLRQQKRK